MSDRPTITPGGPAFTAGQDRQRRQQPEGPSQEAVARLERLLDEAEPGLAPEARPDAEPRRDAEDGRRGDDPDPSAWTVGDAMLRGMGARPAEPEPDGTRPASPERLVDEIASRLLVGGDGAGPSEVRISVKDSVFPGLEIRLASGPSGLTVELIAASAADVAVLRAEAGRLVERLRQRTGREVEVRVRRGDAGPADGAPEPPR